MEISESPPVTRFGVIYGKHNFRCRVRIDLRSLFQKRILKSQNLLELCIYYRAVRKLEAARVFIEIAFQWGLIDYHALPRPRKSIVP
jgi:hypothetical protein